MKKWITVLSVLMMLLLLVACGEKEIATVTDEIVEMPVEEIEEDVVEEESNPETVPVEETPAEEVVVEEEAPVEEVVEEAPVEETASPASVDLSAVCSAMTSQLGISDGFALDTSALMGLYGISADLVKQSGGYVTMSGTFPDEIILVEAVDSAAADAVQACLQTRLNAVMEQSKTYDAENYALAQKCFVGRNGLFLSLILSPKQEELVAVYGNYIG